ncbi:MAG: threonine-phosphate decarboxylase CobD [Actinomycetota bacterium]
MNRIHGGNRIEIAKRYGYEKETLIDFSASINPLGPPAPLLAALKDALKEIAHYPDLEARDLRGALAGYLRVDENNILLGNGSVEIIFLLAQHFRPAVALTFAPTFCEYEIAVQGIGGETIYFELKKEQGFNPDIDEVFDWLYKENYGGADTEVGPYRSRNIVFVCNPNNPTGVLLSKRDLLSLIEEAAEQKMLVVVDEAFMDFVEEKGSVTLVTEAAERDNLIVLGSLSKFFALAGLRLGYAVANSKLAQELRMRQTPWNINILAQLAGETALQDEDFISQTLQYVKENREFLFTSLKEVKGLHPYPSAANYLLVEIKHPNWDSSRLQDKLARRGMIIRDCSTFKGLNNRFFRVAVRSKNENEVLISALKQLI